MPGHQTRRKRWATAARWPLGVGLAISRYFWSTTPVHRWEMKGSWAADGPPPLPPGTDPDELQRVQEGSGPLFHRIYRTRIVGSTLSPAEVMGRMTADLDRVAPSEFATFQEIGGATDHVEVGDRYVVRMPGPWDGPVRVVAAGPTSFRLATLSGHLEAGQIEFRSSADHRSLWFEIESWARSGGRFSDLLYDRLLISKEVQLHMWSSVLRRVIGLTKGRMEGGIVIVTRIVSERALPGRDEEVPRLGDPELARVEELGRRRPNLDEDELAESIEAGTWRLDDLVEPLPSEASGPPAESGSWQVAKDIMERYQLADPGVVDATYDESAPLAGRNMLLRISFKGLRFRVGVRVDRDYEETRELDGRSVLVFGWSYVTLEGHFEEGRMHYELWKWMDTGDVEFHLRAVSRPARRGPLLTRLGFSLFGRTQQLHFYRQICRRVRRLTEAELETRSAHRIPGSEQAGGP
ncbi:MAG TPA: DUF1990 family protein [Solirubrobacterales bacterium]|nr:DUF1990 family protein [Solirubrobacterales bacterium]